jgi:hypothetical protein
MLTQEKGNFFLIPGFLFFLIAMTVPPMRSALQTCQDFRKGGTGSHFRMDSHIPGIF